MVSLLVTPAAANAENGQTLPKRIAKQCRTPPEWVSVAAGGEVHLRPPPDADYAKVDCVLAQLRLHNVVKLGFIGNEADPTRVLNPGWSYIAGGSIAALTALADEVRSAGWVAGPLAKADDGTGFLSFHTPEGMTEVQAMPFATRLWQHQLGDITFGPAPSRNGSGTGGD